MTALSDLKPGQRGIVTGFHHDLNSGNQDSLRQLQEMGVVEGEVLEIRNVAPFGKDPLTIYVRGAVIGMRRGQAAQIEVRLEEQR